MVARSVSSGGKRAKNSKPCQGRHTIGTKESTKVNDVWKYSEHQ